MAWRHLLGSASRATADAAFFGLTLLALPAACGSGEDGEEPAEEPAEPSASPDRSPVPPRPERTAANEPEPDPTEADDESPEDAAPLAPRAAPDESPPAPGAGAGGSMGVSPAAAAAAFTSCTRSEGSYGTNCDYVYVSMTQASPARCVQLTIDNCGGAYSRRGLSVDTPIEWQLSSASIGSSPDDCELGVFYPASDVVVGGSGEIGWDAVESTDLPTAIVVDVTLQPSSTADDTTSVDVVTSEPLIPARCPE